MDTPLLKSPYKFMMRRLKERLWAKPLAYCLAAVIAVFVAHSVDGYEMPKWLLQVDPETIEKLLTIISSSMLAVATFAVASMLSAYGSASQTATPRAFTLMVSDDVSQTALSSFIGAFIFSIVALVAVKTDYYSTPGLFLLFIMTMSIFAWVVVTFVRWTDSIARLGRVGTAIRKVETATRAALEDRRLQPSLGARVPDLQEDAGWPIFSEKIGYVQHVNMSRLQKVAEERDFVITVSASPGQFLAFDQPLVHLKKSDEDAGPVDEEELFECFLIGRDRTFDEDPRFGLIVLSEIASRALSPAVNDPGTAIAIIGTLVRSFSIWARPKDGDEDVLYDRLVMAPLDLRDMIDDGFTAIARDGAGIVEVGIRLQKAYRSLKGLNYPDIVEHVQTASDEALARAKASGMLEIDYKRLEDIAKKNPRQ